MLAVGAMGLGAVGLLTEEFIGLWEPVPTSFPLHGDFARLSGLILLGSGAGLAARWTLRAAALVLALFLLLWVAVLDAPLVAAAPMNPLRWLYLGEVTAIGCGALTLWATPAHAGATIAARLGYALSLLTFGASHFSNLKVTATAVPHYIPAPLAVAAVTGGVHIAAGIALLSGKLPRVASTLEAAMMSAFLLLVDLPAVLARPAHPLAWITLLAEGAVVGAAWIVAAALGADGPVASSLRRRCPAGRCRSTVGRHPEAAPGLGSNPGYRSVVR